MKHALIATAFIASFASALFAGSEYWTDRKICRAATKTYFFLDAMPTTVQDKEDLFGFRSSAGYIYFCRIEGTSTAFYWENGSGEAMESKSSSFSIHSNRLRIKTDMGEEDFMSE